MNNLLASLPPVQASFDSAPGPFSNYMLFELLTMHEELIGQLRLEGQEPGSNIGFLKEIINQHEQAVIMLHALIDNHQALVG